MTPPPQLTALADLDSQMASAGWAVLDAASLRELAGLPAGAFAAWPRYWHDLPADPHMMDGGRYRQRRHSCFELRPAARMRTVGRRAHWQPLDYNALHGGIERWFEPMPETWLQDPAWQALLVGLAGLASRLRGEQAWFVEAHPFRITTEGGIGRPTPEGAHRDGVDLVAVMLFDRHNIKGGETRVFDARGPQGMRFTLSEAGSVLLLDDERVIHESTPIQPVDSEQPAWRDTLVLTLRGKAFQGPELQS